MIDRRRFLAVSASGLMMGAATVAIPTDAHATTTTTAGSAVKMKSWKRLTGASVRAIDAHGRSFALTVDRVIATRTAGGGRGESFSVVLRARSRHLTDGMYRLTHRDIGGSSDLFLVGGGATTATLSVDTRVAPQGP